MTNPDQHPSLVDGDQVDSLSRDHAHTHNAAREADASSLVNSAASPARERWHDAHCNADPSLPLWRPGSGCSCRKDCWRDIESAPRDGTYVLTFQPDPISWWHDIQRINEDGIWVDQEGYHCASPPTHWQPLPEAPR